MPKRTRKPKLPPDPEGQNDERAEWAHAALEAFTAATGTDECDAVCDLIADLHHWCDRNGQEFDVELNRSQWHYHEETSGSGERPSRAHDSKIARNLRQRMARQS